jgi:hypothetical protein
VPLEISEAGDVDGLVDGSLQCEADGRCGAGADSANRPAPAGAFLNVDAGVGSADAGQLQVSGSQLGDAFHRIALNVSNPAEACGLSFRI